MTYKEIFNIDKSEVSPINGIDFYTMPFQLDHHNIPSNQVDYNVFNARFDDKCNFSLRIISVNQQTLMYSNSKYNGWYINGFTCYYDYPTNKIYLPKEMVDKNKYKKFHLTLAFLPAYCKIKINDYNDFLINKTSEELKFKTKDYEFIITTRSLDQIKKDNFITLDNIFNKEYEIYCKHEHQQGSWDEMILKLSCIRFIYKLLNECEIPLLQKPRKK